MADAPQAKRWGRWTQGRYRLHLQSGRAVDFAGKIRTQTDADSIIAYDAQADSVVMFPHFDDVQAIERLDI